MLETSSSTGTDPRYGYTVHLPGVDYTDAREQAIAALKEQGFGVLTEIDVRDTMKKKLGVEFRRYTILGACNPELSHQGLGTELGLGLLLPCNVCVWEEDGGSVVSLLRPDVMTTVAGNPGLEPMAREARARLERARNRLAGS